MQEEETEEMTVLNFRVPISVKKMLEAYAKQNGYSISYLLRKVVEMEIISPDLPLQSELWKDFIEWRNKTNETLLEVLKIQKNTAETLDFQIQVLFRILEKLTGQPIRQILDETLEEWKAKKKAEKGDEKNE